MMFNEGPAKAHRLVYLTKVSPETTGVSHAAAVSNAVHCNIPFANKFSISLQGRSQRYQFFTCQYLDTSPVPCSAAVVVPPELCACGNGIYAGDYII